MTRMHQGWGMPDLQNLYDLRDKIYVVDESDLLQEFDGLLTVPRTQIIELVLEELDVPWKFTLVSPLPAPGQRNDGFTAVTFHRPALDQVFLLQAIHHSGQSSFCNQGDVADILAGHTISIAQGENYPCL